MSLRDAFFSQGSISREIELGGTPGLFFLPLMAERLLIFFARLLFFNF